MKAVLLAVLLLLLKANVVWAGISVCHTGETVTRTALRGDPIPGCEYLTVPQTATQQEYDDARTLIKTVRRDFLKWTTALEEMTQVEKDAVTAATQAAYDDSVRQQAKVDTEAFSQEGVRLRAALIYMIQQVNALRAQHSLAPLTKQEVIDAIKAIIDSQAAD